MKRPLVKVCGMTRVEDIELALSLGADFLGIIVYPKSPRAVSLDRIPELLKHIPQGKRVVVDVAPSSEWMGAYSKLGFDHYQIHFNLNTAMSELAVWSGLAGESALWAAPRIPAGETKFPQIVLEFADTLLVDTFNKDQFGGTGETGDWQRFLDWATLYQHKRWVLAGGLSSDNIAIATATADPDVVDVNSCVESSPGVKDPAKLKAFFEALQEGVSGN